MYRASYKNRPEVINAGRAKAENILGKKLQEVRKARRMTAEDLTRELARRGIDVHLSVVSKWELGQVVPNSYQLLALCSVFDIQDPVAFFTGNQPLNAEGMEKLYSYKQDLLATGLYAPAMRTDPIAYITMHVSMMAASAGTGNFLDDENFEEVSFPANSVPDGADFGIRVAGDSMEPVYSDGQIVWVKECAELRSGEVGIFMLDGEGYIKMYSEDASNADEENLDINGVPRRSPVLVSYNSKYAPIHITAERNLQIVGRVL